MRAPLPPDEAERLRSLHALEVLDSESEPLFDALTRAAAIATGMPIALLSLVDADRQWFKSNFGLTGTAQTSRDAAFCAHTILGDEVLEVADARVDARFTDNPLVTDGPCIRFYAGAPITLSDGSRIGSVCVIDREPRSLSKQQRSILAELGRAAAMALEQRQHAMDRSRALARQREAETWLAEDRLRLSNLIESMRVGTWEWNIVSGSLLLNSSWEALIGRTIDELEPASIETWQRFCNENDWSQLQRAIESHFQGNAGEVECELRMLHKNGSEIWVRCRGRVMQRNDVGAPLRMCGALADISRAKQTEARLQASEAFLDRTGRMARVGGWELDLETREFTFSDQVCRIHEVPPGFRPDLDEALGFYPAEARATLEEAVRKSVGDGRGWDLELPFVTARGTQAWVRVVGTVEYAEGKPRWLIGALQEITLRRRAIRALEVSERRFRKLFQHSLGLICTHDLEGYLVSVNPAAANQLGYSVSEMVGRHFGEIMPEELRPQFEQYLQRIVAAKTDSGVIRLKGRDGSLHTWQYHNVLDDEDEHPYVLGHALDITEREQHEKTLKEMTMRDPLTGCFNRRILYEIEKELRPGDRWACIAVDLDRFKLVNDTHGHQRGDEVLIGMGQFLSRHVRPRDRVVRAGGDEFLVLLRDVDESGVRRVVEALRSDTAEAPIAFTLGSAVRSPGASLEATIAIADDALYAQRSRDRG